jgi:hypothetical protein
MSMSVFSQIPQELKDRPQWICWKKVMRDGKEVKIPVNPRTGGQAAVDKPATYASYDMAIAAANKNGNAGIGFVFTVGDPYVGVDLDFCIEDGVVHSQATEVLKLFNSYAEKSQSGRGLHIFIKGKLPPGGRRKGKLEMYDSGRFFVMTGAHLDGTPTSIENRQTELEGFHARVFGKPQDHPKPAAPSPSLTMADSEIVGKARSAKNGVKFDQLYRGDWQGASFPSQSEADLAFCSMVAFYTQDPEEIDRIYRASGLYRQKWDSRRGDSTYGAKCIDKALAGVTETYTPPRSAPGADRTKSETPKPHQAEKPREAPQQPPQAKPTPPAIRLVTGSELQSLEFKEPSWIIPRILPEGLCLLSARPKKGKTWLAFGVSVARASGGYALGKEELRITPGKVLYLALEDKLRRAKKRLEIILGGAPFPDDLITVESWPRLDKGGLEALQVFLKEHDDCKLVVVDSFAKIKPPRPKNIDPYEFDMAVGGALQSLAQDHQICLLLIYHNRKTEGEDPLDDVIGGTGLTGAVDAVLILRRGRGQADATLFITGRDVEEQELALRFHPGEGLWELMGTVAECAMSQERKDILLVLSEVGPKTPAQLAKIIGKKYDAIRINLVRMKDAGLVRLKENGEYQSV